MDDVRAELAAILQRMTYRPSDEALVSALSLVKAFLRIRDERKRAELVNLAEWIADQE